MNLEIETHEGLPCLGKHTGLTTIYFICDEGVEKMFISEHNYSVKWSFFG
jgi:hypothetical protein